MSHFFLPLLFLCRAVVVTSAVAIALGQDILTWNKPAALVLILIGVYLVTTSRSKADRSHFNEVRQQNTR